MNPTDFLVSSVSLEESATREEENKAAWDRLYASTSDLIWGADPLPFVDNAIARLRRDGMLPEQPRILDAASGEGRNLPTLLNASKEVTACDASSAALAKLRSRFGRRIKTVECDLARMPFASYTFDLVLACDIIETLPNPVEVLSEIARILRPGGVLIANVPDFRDGIADHEMEPLPSGEFLYQGNYFFRFQEENEFRAMLADCDLTFHWSETETWTEGPHPGYRAGVHEHTSQIIAAVHRIS